MSKPSTPDRTDDAPATTRNDQLYLARIEGKSADYAVARSGLDPEVRHAALAINASADLFKGDMASVADMGEALRDVAAEAAAQDMSGVGRTLTAQALSLDALFTQLVRKAHVNLSTYPDAAERYMRLAFKAQSQSRSTLEALVKLHQPREQTVRHVHVGPDGQAVFIENLHGVPANVRLAEQPHAAATDAGRAALRSPDPLGTPLPLAGHAERALPHARGAIAGRADRQPECVEAWGAVSDVPGTAPGLE